MTEIDMTRVISEQSLLFKEKVNGCKAPCTTGLGPWSQGGHWLTHGSHDTFSIKVVCPKLLLSPQWKNTASLITNGMKQLMNISPLMNSTHKGSRIVLGVKQVPGSLDPSTVCSSFLAATLCDVTPPTFQPQTKDCHTSRHPRLVTHAPHIFLCATDVALPTWAPFWAIS